MRHINRVTLLGHAGDDPRNPLSPSSGGAASFSLVMTERWKCWYRYGER